MARATYTDSERAALVGMAVANPSLTWEDAVRYVPQLAQGTWDIYRKAADVFRREPARFRAFTTLHPLPRLSGVLGWQESVDEPEAPQPVP